MNRAPIRVGVIGIGFGQAVHVPAFRSVPGCEVIGIAASRADRARRVADLIGLPLAFAGWEEVVECPDVDLVTIAVPPDIQPRIVEAAAARGKHVLCEKPLAVSAEEARRALASVASAGICHAMDFEFPELPAWRALWGTVQTGSLGAVREVRIEWRVPRARHSSEGSAWKDEPAKGGGVLGGFMSHALYHVEWLAGAFRSLLAEPLDPEADRTKTAVVSGELEDGARSWVSIDAAASGTMAHVVTVSAEKGQAVLANVGGQHGGPFELMVTGAESRRSAEPPLGDGDSRVRAVAALGARLSAAIVAGGEMRPDLRDGLRVQQLLEAVERSAGTARAVEIP